MAALLVGLGYLVGYAIQPDFAIAGVVIAVLIWLVLNLISAASGSKIMLSVSGAKEVTRDVHPQLFNVVEEMKLAGALPTMPKIYIINSQAPNAFATGRTPENSAIAVTAGLLEQLNRDELQGVIAHETAHIFNRDIRFMTYAGIMLGTIVMISEVFLRGMFWSSALGGRRSSSNSGGGQGQLIIMIIAIAFAVLAPLFAQLFYFAISRKREYLADATAVRFTRYPEGLASALEKIANNSSEIPSANKITAPMYIANPLKKKGMKMANLTSTHPPISERIKILRNISGGANYTDYQEAFSEVKGKQSTIIPKSGLAETDEIHIRSAFVGDQQAPRSFKQSTRDLSDLMMKVDNYEFINCSCGLKLKIPPDYSYNTATCPKCGTKHNVRKG